MTLSSMTFHESFGHLPNYLLSKYRRLNVSPADHDRMLNALGHTWEDTDIDWYRLDELLTVHSVDGMLRLPYYL